MKLEICVCCAEPITSGDTKRIRKLMSFQDFSFFELCGDDFYPIAWAMYKWCDHLICAVFSGLKFAPMAGRSS